MTNKMTLNELVFKQNSKIRIFLLTTLIISAVIFVCAYHFNNKYGFTFLKKASYNNVNYDSLSTDKILSSTKEFKETIQSGFNEIHISFDFNANSISKNDDLFQTAPDNLGLRLELLNPAVLDLIAGCNNRSGYRTIDIDRKIEQNKWYNVEIWIDANKKLIVLLNKRTIIDDVRDELNFKISDICIGSGYSKTRPFDGKISNFEVSYLLFNRNIISYAMWTIGIVAFLFLLISVFLLVCGLYSCSYNRKTTGKILFLLSILILFLSFYDNFFMIADPNWFDYFQTDSESLVIGRMVKSAQDGIFSDGALLGTGEPFSSEKTAISKQYKSYLNNIPFNKYYTYESQLGAQGIVFSMLNEILPFASEIKLNIFYAINALLSAIVLSAIILWFYLEFGLSVSLFVFSSVFLSEILVGFGRNLYWTLWVLYLPSVLILYILRFKWEMINTKRITFGAAVFIVILIKCLFSGFEYITASLIMMTVPFVYYSVMNRLKIRMFVGGFFTLVIGACLASFVCLSILCFQIAAERSGGSFKDGINHIIYDLEKRSNLNPKNITDLPSQYVAAQKTPTLSVINSYLYCTSFDANKYVVPSNRLIAYILDFSYGRLLLFFAIMSGILFWLIKKCKDSYEKQKYSALLYTTWFSILAPLSWFIVFKAHAVRHHHIDYLVWQMPFIFFGFAVAGLVVKILFRDKQTENQ